MSNILKLDNVAEKTEQLLSFKEILKDKKDEASNHFMSRAMLFGIGGVVLTGIIVAVIEIAAPVAAAVVFWAGLTASFAGCFKEIYSDSVSSDKIKTMKEKTNKEVTALISSNLHEVVNSPKFQQSIKSGFNYAADIDAEFADLKTDVAKKKTAALSKG
jgi:hypothetical protein